MIERDQLHQLYQYGLSLTRDAQDAHDLLQSALERWLKQGNTADNPEAYIRRIMRNLYIDECRRRKRVAFEPLTEGDPVILDETSLEQQYIDRDIVEQLLGQLNAAEREVLFMWAVLEYSASEIAHELDSPRGTILSRLFRVKKKAQKLAGTQDIVQPLSAGANT